MRPPECRAIEDQRLVVLDREWDRRRGRDAGAQAPAEAVERRVVQIDLILQLSDVAAGRQLIEPCPAEPDWSIAS
jgi:hypothetical protein